MASKDSKSPRQLTDADAVYRSFFEVNPQPMWVYDMESLRFLAVNRAAVAHYGYSAEEFLEMKITEIRPSEDVPRLLMQVHEPVSGIRDSGMWRHRKKNGELIDVEVASHKLDFGGRPAKLVLVNDVTERRRAEAELRDREERLRLAVQAANIGLWDWNILTSKANFAPEWKKQLGFKEDEIGDDVSEWRDRVHPDDIGPTMAYMERNFAQPEKTPGIEFRLRHKDGSWRWIHSRGKVFRDETGKPARMLGGNVDITERKLAEEALRDSLERFQILARATNDAVWDWDLVADTVWWNEGFQSLFGYAPQEIEPGPESWSNRIHPEDIDLALKTIHSAIDGDQQSWSCEYRFRRADASYATVYDRGYVLRDAAGRGVRMIGAMQDITERKLAEERVRQLNRTYSVLSDINQLIVRERELGKVFEQACKTAVDKGRFLMAWIGMTDDAGKLHVSALAGAPDGMRQTIDLAYDNPQRHCPFTNRALASGEYAVCNDVETDPLAEQWRDDVRQLGCRSMASFPLTLRGKRVGVFNLYADRAEFFDADELRLLDELSHDVSYAIEVFERERERRALAQQLAQSQKMQAIGTLAGGIAHDFNNVLAAIIGNAKLARQDLEAGHPAQTSIDEIARAGQRAKDLVQRILTFSRPQEQRLGLIDLGAVLSEAIQLLRPTIPAGVQLRFEVERDLPVVRADASQVHQVAINLTTNAWHAMERQRGCIDIRLEACNVDTLMCCGNPDLHPGPYVRLSVRDNGVGMDAATLERIYEPFFTTKPPGQGVGLGLPVVHGIIGAHGGAIAVESELGKGTTFHIYFPVDATTQVAPMTVSTNIEDEARGNGERILFLDDEEPLVYLAVRHLERLGYRVDGHTQADEALVAFRADPRSYSLVITDYNMPGMSGMDVAEQLKQIDPNAKIVLASGYVRQAEIDRARSIGIREVILKPNTIEELGPVVRRLVAATAP